MRPVLVSRSVLGVLLRLLLSVFKDSRDSLGVCPTELAGAVPLKLSENDARGILRGFDSRRLHKRLEIARSVVLPEEHLDLVLQRLGERFHRAFQVLRPVVAVQRDRRGGIGVSEELLNDAHVRVGAANVLRERVAGTVHV